jgi:hypothetical protein
VAVDEALADSSLEDRGNQIALPLLALARTPEARAAIVGALRQQQDAVATDRADSWEGEVFAVILRIQRDGTVRPADVAAEVNRERASADGIEIDRLGKRLMTKEQAGRILREGLELPKGGRDKTGVWYDLEPARMVQLAQRYDIPLGNLHNLHHLHLHPENGPGAIKNAENVGSVGSVGSGEAGVGCGEPTPADGPPALTEADAGAALDWPLDEADEAAIALTLGGDGLC